jgi:hypothetical protein
MVAVSEAWQVNWLPNGLCRAIHANGFAAKELLELE